MAFVASDEINSISGIKNCKNNIYLPLKGVNLSYLSYLIAKIVLKYWNTCNWI